MATETCIEAHQIETVEPWALESGDPTTMAILHARRRARERRKYEDTSYVRLLIEELDRINAAAKDGLLPRIFGGHCAGR